MMLDAEIIYIEIIRHLYDKQFVITKKNNTYKALELTNNKITKEKECREYEEAIEEIKNMALQYL